MKCDECKYAYMQEDGYSNYTAEGTTLVQKQDQS